MLHLIFQKEIDSAVFQRINIGDAVVFMGEGVLRTLASSIWSNQFSTLQSKATLYVLQDDIEIRGIEPQRLVQGIRIIDYTGLVTLTVDNKTIQSWC